MRCLPFLALAAATLSPAQISRQPADLVIRNARIATMDAPEFAQAIAIRGERITAVGANAAMAEFTGPGTRVIDARGAFLMPGFIESHGHFMGLGQFQRSLNLREARSWEEITRMVAAAAREAKPGAWIIGRGFHQSKWTTPPAPHVQGFPVHDALTKAAPQNPVLLAHASGHAAMVNARAMEESGITRETRDPRGGALLRDAQGNLTGLLNERAQGLAYRAYNAYLGRRPAAVRAADARAEAALAFRECLRNGVTSFQDAGSSFETVDLFRALRMEGRLDVRLWVMLNEPDAALAARGASYRVIDTEKQRLTVRAIKRSLDGALGSRGAWLLAPYSDLPSSSGLNTTPLESLRATAAYALAHGFQLCVHAIGDRANRETLNVFEEFIRRKRSQNPVAPPASPDLRWRVEHAQHLSAADIPRFAALGVIASMQGIHCTSDAPYVLARLGAQRAEEGAYVWRKLLDSGATIANGTDVPVEEIGPIANFYASVTRKGGDGAAFYPAQRMTRLEAMRSYTIQAARAAFEENDKGSIRRGKLADVVILSRDLLSVPEEEIRSTEVLYTIVGGKVMYEKAPR
ncbi:MAG: amidohydrolase [Bryobacterales bacterium]|nr:amidohydrolase [Bryobacterales bacterium]